MNRASKDPLFEKQREAARARRAVGDDLRALGTKVSSDNIKRQANAKWDETKTHATEIVRHKAERTVETALAVGIVAARGVRGSIVSIGQAMRKNPYASLVVGVGVACVFYQLLRTNSRRSSARLWIWRALPRQQWLQQSQRSAEASAERLLRAPRQATRRAMQHVWPA